MGRTYLISTKYLKDNTVVNDNIDDNLLSLAIWDAQNIHIQSLIGSCLYDKIISLVETGDISIPANAHYKTLLDMHIRPLLAILSQIESIVYLKFKFVNKGITEQSSENSSSIDIEGIKYLNEKLTNKGEFYQQRLIGYLKTNRSMFPELECCGCTALKAMHNAYFSGIQFDENNK